MGGLHLALESSFHVIAEPYVSTVGIISLVPSSITIKGINDSIIADEQIFSSSYLTSEVSCLDLPHCEKYYTSAMASS